MIHHELGNCHSEYEQHRVALPAPPSENIGSQISMILICDFVNFLFSVPCCDILFLGHTGNTKFHLQQPVCQKHSKGTKDLMKCQTAAHQSKLLEPCSRNFFSFPKSSIKIFLTLSLTIHQILLAIVPFPHYLMYSKSSIIFHIFPSFFETFTSFKYCEPLHSSCTIRCP